MSMWLISVIGCLLLWWVRMWCKLGVMLVWVMLEIIFGCLRKLCLLICLVVILLV